ncbi:MAG: glycosyltransferase family 2 protein [bacterium]|nr:glycosyltransferase family 2 protein [bacterium]
MKKQLSIVVPAYNEEKIIDHIIDELKKELEKIPELEYEIIIINDCSIDKTGIILEKIPGIKLINHDKNKGYGASLKGGIKESKFDWILIIDADGTYPISSIPELLNYIPEYDMTVGARKIYRPFYGKPAKWILNKLASYLAESKVMDLNSGMRIFKKEMALKFWGLFPERFSFSSTLTMVCLTNNYSLKYVKIDYLKRSGKSKLKPIKSFKQFAGLITKLSLYFKPLKIFVPISVFLFLAGALIFIYSAVFTDKILDATTAIFIISSIQILAIGMIADLIVKTHK